MSEKSEYAPKWLIATATGFVLLVLAAILWPVFMREHPRPVDMCVSHLKQSMLGQALYGAEHDEHLPPATVWMDACAPYVKNEGLFACPYAREANPKAYGHAMNFATSTATMFDVPNPADTIVLFDSVLLARNACSGFYGLPDPPRHKINRAAFMDTHVTRLSPEQIATYGPNGRPKQARP